MKQRLWNTTLIFLACLHVLMRGTARGVLQNKPRVFAIINPTGNIGDMVCTTPVFRAIKKNFPDARVIVLGAPKNERMMEGNTDIDRYVSLKRPFWETVKILKSEHIDAGVVINPSTLDFVTLFLSGTKVISCFTLAKSHKQYEARIYKLVSKLGNQITYTPGTYVPGQYLKLLKPFGVLTNEIQKHVGYTEAGKTHVLTQLHERGLDGTKLVAIAPGAGTKVKQWPSERFGQVANYISEKYGLGTVIIGGPGDVTEAETMIAALKPETRYLNCVQHSLDELKATLSLVTLIIGNDSGPIYVAESFGAGTIVLVGPTDEAEHPLNDATHRIVMARAEGDALLQSCVSGEDSIDMQKARAQIEAITVAQVCAEIESVFKELKIETK